MQSKRGGEVDKAMRLESRQHDLREGERIDPRTRKGTWLGLAHDEVSVEAGVVRDEVAATRELGQCGDRLARTRGARYICLCDARELGDLFWNGISGIDERVKLTHGLAAAHADGGNLEQRAA